MDIVYKKIELIHPYNAGKLIATRYNFEGDRLILHGEEFMLVDRNSDVKLLAYCDDGVIDMAGRVTMSIPTQVNIDITAVGKANDRRDFLKVKTDDEGLIISFYMPGTNKKKFSAKDNVKFRDISAGGICFYSNKVYFAGQRLRIDLYSVADRLEVDAIILRKKKESYLREYKYRYACKFVNIDPISERKLFEYSFRTEIENHRKEQEKDLKIYD